MDERLPFDAMEHNRLAWDRMAGARDPLARPARREDLVDALATVDGLGWLGPSIRGWRVLCLAAGGGRQSALYAAAGGEVTVVDLSPAMLALDRQVAAEHQLNIRTVESSMDQLDMLAASSFDLVIHPVSTCYLSQVAPVFQAVARVLRPGGLYISQHKSPTNLQASCQPGTTGYAIHEPYYRSRQPVAPPAQWTAAAQRLRESRAVEYLHRWEELLGGICRAGFVIEDLVEPLHAQAGAAIGSFEHRAQFIAPYFKVKARRRGLASAHLTLLERDHPER
jgi:ubiquinone/menaquinone biosynthesis C-methylase UbiE